MEREILFRGWSVEPEFSEGWVYGYYNPESETMTLLCHNVGLRVCPESVGQATGLYAANEKLIFEGDYDKDGAVMLWGKWRGGWTFGGLDLETGELFEKCHEAAGDYFLRDYLPEFLVAGNLYELRKEIERKEGGNG